jgi:hypothetical protein
VAKFTCGSVRSPAKFAVHHDPSANSSTKRHHDRIGSTDCGTGSMLCQGSTGGVVVRSDRQSNPLGKKVFDRHIFERKVSGADNPAN